MTKTRQNPLKREIYGNVDKKIIPHPYIIACTILVLIVRIKP